MDEHREVKAEPPDEEHQQETKNLFTDRGKGIARAPSPESIPIVTHRSAVAEKEREHRFMNSEKMSESSEWASKRRTKREEDGRYEKKKKGIYGEPVIASNDIFDQEREVPKVMYWEAKDEVKLLKCFQEYLQTMGLSSEEFSCKSKRLKPSYSFGHFAKGKFGFAWGRRALDKVWSLKERYRSLARKHLGKRSVFRTPDYNEVFLLSNEIWGDMKKKKNIAEEKDRCENEIRGDKNTVAKKKHISERDLHLQEDGSVCKEHDGDHGREISPELVVESVERLSKTPMEMVAYVAGGDDSVEISNNSKKISNKSEKIKRGERRRSTKEIGSSTLSPMLSLDELIEKGLQTAKKSKLKKLGKRQRELDIATLTLHLERQKLDVKRTKLKLKRLIRKANHLRIVGRAR